MIGAALVALPSLLLPGFVAWAPGLRPIGSIAQEGAVERSPAAAPTAAAPTADERAQWEARERELLQRITELENSLIEVQERSLARQQEWIAFTRLLRGFELPNLPEPPEFVAEAFAPDVDPLAEAAARELARLRGRATEISASLRALLTAEGVRGIDLLEVGLLLDHEGRTWTGPIIARLLDERGRMVGMLKASRMRLETSRASRTVTILLEEGYESRGGQRRPFDGGVVTLAPGQSDYVVTGGVRRVFLGSADPAPWIEELPELVDPAMLEPRFDDGLWDVTTVRVELVRLLRNAAASGDPNWRLVGLGGIQADELRDVQFAELDAVTGRAKRRVFADSARLVAPDAGGVQILLEGGTVRRGERIAPFLAGRYRIMLPRADPAAWRDAQLPGLSAPPLKPAIDSAPPAGGVAPTRRSSSAKEADGQKPDSVESEAKDEGAGGNDGPPVR